MVRDMSAKIGRTTLATATLDATYPSNKNIYLNIGTYPDFKIIVYSMDQRRFCFPTRRQCMKGK